MGVYECVLRYECECVSACVSTMSVWIATSGAWPTPAPLHPVTSTNEPAWSPLTGAPDTAATRRQLSLATAGPRLQVSGRGARRSPALQAHAHAHLCTHTVCAQNPHSSRVAVAHVLSACTVRAPDHWADPQLTCGSVH